MSAELRAAWWEHLAGARWFGGKGAAASLTALEPLGWYTAPGATPAVRSEIATVGYADGRVEHYHLLAAYRPGPDAGPLGRADVPGLGGCAVSDASTEPDALAAFVAALATRPGAHYLPLAPLPGFAEAAVWPLGGEQSNTTLCVGPDALLKLFRKVEPGPNLDAEVLEALAGDQVPVLHGRLVGAWPAGRTTDLGMMVARVPGARDGWEVATAACVAGEDFAGPAAALGEALREVHVRLREAFGTATRTGDDLAATMTGRLDRACEHAPALAPHAPAIARAFTALAGHAFETQRVHGDFHLGQTLTSPAGWTIIDFEGEPAKTAAERREFDSVWRDVAGMLRSFDYARSAHPDPGSPTAVGWATAAREAFLAGYTAGGSSDAAVLRAYELDKAAYEVVYEVRNRPAWVDIPLRAIREQA